MQLGILKEIFVEKLKEINLQKKAISEAFLRQEAEKLTLTRNFKRKLQHTIQQGNFGIVAEVKRASPYYGISIKKLFPAELALTYARGGATCIAVHTDQHFFKGKNEDLIQVRNSSNLPILRKDFVISKYQIYETAYLGADAILLTVSMLDKIKLRDYNILARELGLDVVLEVNSMQDIENAMQLPNKIICINSRNLTSLKADLQDGIALAKNLNNEEILMIEGGIKTKQDVQLLLENNINSCILGGTLINSENPINKIKDIFYS